MKIRTALMTGALLCAVTASYADTYYVATNSASDGPGTAWSNAFHTIQGGVDAATNTGDTVLVTNGVYDIGGAVTPGYSLSNRVVITRDITVQSVNGAGATIIGGAEATGGGSGSNAVRGVYMSAGVLSGFTITNGYTRTSGDPLFDRSGGGALLNAGGTV